MMMDQTNIYREVILTNVCYKLYQRRTIQEKNKENKWKYHNKTINNDMHMQKQKKVNKEPKLVISS